MPSVTNSVMVTSGAAIPSNLKEMFRRHVELHEMVLLREVGKPLLQADETLNNSDKTFTVPVRTTWELLSIWAELATTANAGNRRLGIEFQDDNADVIMGVLASAPQTASLARSYRVGPSAADGTSFIGNTILTVNMPRLILPAGYIVRVFDVNAVDAAADNLVLQMMVVERTEI